MTVQFFLSMIASPLTEDEYAQYPMIRETQFVLVAEANGRMLFRGMIDPERPFDQIIGYLVATEREPDVLMVLNQDGTNYDAELWPRKDAEYQAFFQPYEIEVDGETVTITPPQNTGAGWLLEPAQQGEPNE